MTIGGGGSARIAAFLLLAVVASVIYGQAPLYTSNQNQYFLHGLARAGFGFLRDDWLARTVDPTPVFSVLVDVTYRYLHPYLFYGYYVVLVGVYFASLVGLTAHALDLGKWRAGFLIYLGLLMAMHAALLGNLSLGLAGLDVRAVLTDGVAGLGVLGNILQPSVFGVVLITSIYAFVRERPLLAVVCAALAAIVHPTYLLGAAVLILSYVVSMLTERRGMWRSLLPGLAGLALAAPIVGYAYYAFRPTSAATWLAAADVLMNVRSPHHFLMRRWLGPPAYVQVAVVLAAVAVVRRPRRLYSVLLFSAVAAGALTAAQVITGSATLALLIPWRLFVYLVPIASSVLAASLILWMRDRHLLEGEKRVRRLAWGSLCVIVVLLFAGALYMRRDFEESRVDASVPMMDFVRQTEAAGDVYLIPLDLERFRLYTGARVFADRKSIPYKDVELLEWHTRYLVGTAFYRLNDPALVCESLVRLSSAYSLTHVVLVNGQTDGGCRRLRKLYADSEYGVYRLVPQ